MTFDHALLETYHTLLRTTDLQRAYQEFIRSFRYLRNRLEQQMPDFRFQSGISENAMEYAYFSFTNLQLKEKGLKLVVAFVHSHFQLEIWLSGVNRTAQCRWASQMIANALPMEIAEDPAHMDYLVRLPVEVDLADADFAVAMVEAEIKKMVQCLFLQQ